jgi:hypothetical protein
MTPANHYEPSYRGYSPVSEEIQAIHPDSSDDEIRMTTCECGHDLLAHQPAKSDPCYPWFKTTAFPLVL